MSTLITFDNSINSSIQLGDIAYYATDLGNGISSSPILAGTIINVSNKSIVVNTDMSLSGNAYFLFAKNIHANESSLKGYWADVKLTNNSNERVELFAVSSETTFSSK